MLKAPSVENGGDTGVVTASGVADGTGVADDSVATVTVGAAVVAVAVGVGERRSSVGGGVIRTIVGGVKTVGVPVGLTSAVGDRVAPGVSVTEPAEGEARADGLTAAIAVPVVDPVGAAAVAVSAAKRVRAAATLTVTAGAGVVCHGA